jgi:hypothetical protein
VRCAQLVPPDLQTQLDAGSWLAQELVAAIPPGLGRVNLVGGYGVEWLVLGIIGLVLIVVIAVVCVGEAVARGSCTSFMPSALCRCCCKQRADIDEKEKPLAAAPFG